MSADYESFEKDRIWTILKRVAPPIVLSNLVVALYNVVDSLFLGSYSADALTALSVIFPLQLLIVALAVGTGTGVNALMAKMFADRQEEDAWRVSGTGTLMAVVMWFVFNAVMIPGMGLYVASSVNEAAAYDFAVTYGTIVCLGSIGMFLESNWTKVHQSHGDMNVTMVAQVLGTASNIVLDAILIFGIGPFPEMGVAGAAVATVVAQTIAALVVLRGGLHRIPSVADVRRLVPMIYRYAIPSILLQAMYTVYIVVFNVILAGFGDEAVTVLGLYYKLQYFFFIPLFAMQTCLVPVLSYNYIRRDYSRCRELFRDSVLVSVGFMVIGVLFFELCPGWLISLFTDSEKVVEIGVTAFRLIALSFFSVGASLMYPVFFQAIGMPRASSLLTVVRHLVLLIPIFWIMSLFGLWCVWLTFPIADTLAMVAGHLAYRRCVSGWHLDASSS